MPIQGGNLRCADFKVVSDEYDFFTSIVIIVADGSERFGIKCVGPGLGQPNGKVSPNAILAGEVPPMADYLAPHVVFWPGNPIGTSQMEPEELVEIHIGLVYHIEGKRLRHKQFKLVAVMPSSIRDVDVGRDAPAQVKQGVNLHRSPAVFPQSPCHQFDTGGDCR